MGRIASLLGWVRDIASLVLVAIISVAFLVALSFVGSTIVISMLKMRGR